MRSTSVSMGMRFQRPLILAAILLFTTTTADAQVLKSPADTGRMTWGRIDFSRYVGARPCDRAIRATEFLSSRVYNRDTAFRIALLSAADAPIAPEAFAIAKACGSKFTLATIDPAELWSLLRISFALQDDAQALAAFERRLSLAESVNEQITVLVKGVDQMFREQPARIANIMDLLGRLDALGEAAVMQRIDVRIRLLDYWYDRYQVDSIQAYAARILALSAPLSPAQRNAIELKDVWDMLLVVANATGDIRAQHSVLDSALVDFAAWRGGEGGQWVAGKTQLVDMREATYGKKARALPADAWANDGGHVHPALGKLSVILKTNHNCGTKCYDQYNIVRQLIAQHGANLDLTFAVGTWGYAPGSGVLTPAEEVGAIERYFVQYHELPVAIAVFTSDVDTLDDGRIARRTSSLNTAFGSSDAIIVDKDGFVRWIGPLKTRNDKRMIDAAIDHILQTSPSQS